jgi:hypothetical protein
MTMDDGTAVRHASAWRAESYRAAVHDLDEVRGILALLLNDPPSPAVERMVQDADVLCHAALWMLGETRSLTPEGADGTGPVEVRHPRHPAGHGAARGRSRA